MMKSKPKLRLKRQRRKSMRKRGSILAAAAQALVRKKRRKRRKNPKQKEVWLLLFLHLNQDQVDSTMIVLLFLSKRNMPRDLSILTLGATKTILRKKPSPKNYL